MIITCYQFLKEQDLVKQQITEYLDILTEEIQKAEFGPDFTTNLEVPPEQIKVLKFLPQGKMIEKEVDPELVEKVRAMSNIDP